MADQKNQRVPGTAAQPDPQNLRQRPFQGGTDSLTESPTDGNQVRTPPGQAAKFEARDITSVSDGAGQADTGSSPALMSEPD